MKKNLTRLLICASFFLIGTAVLAADFGGIGGRPAHPYGNIPHSKQWFIYTLKPGENKDDSIIVQNNTPKEVDILLYPADSTPSTDGGFALEQMVEHRDFVGAWITLSKEKLHVPAYESVEVPFKIAIPNDQKLDVGEHSGGILIQRIKESDGSQKGLQILTRVGVRVYVTIPGEIIKKLEIEKLDSELDQIKKQYVAHFVVKNSGNVSQDITVNFRVENAYAFFNRLFKEFPIERQQRLQVLRNSSLTTNFDFPKPLFGKLTMTGSIEYDNGQKILTAPATEFFVPVDGNILILIILVVVLIGFCILLIILKRHDKEKKSKSSKIRRSSN